jgi:hypothetical protein
MPTPTLHKTRVINTIAFNRISDGRNKPFPFAEGFAFERWQQVQKDQ